MKTNMTTPRHVVQFVVCAILLLTAPRPVFSAASSAVNGGKDAPKTHVLFMGADISVEKDKMPCRVQDVSETALLVNVNGKPTEVSMDQTAGVLITETLKITETTVTINNLKSEQDYTPEADPFRKVVQGAQMDADRSTDIARSHATAIQRYTGLTQQDVSAAAQGESNTPAKVAAQAAITEAASASSMSMDTPSAFAELAGGETIKGGFDAIRLSFDLSPDKDLIQPFYAVVVQLRNPSDKPGLVRKWAHIKSLPPIKAGSSKKVSFFEGGVPVGYEIQSCTVHVYDHGKELATNLSHNRVSISAEEAHDYNVIEYISANKGQTLKAALVADASVADTRSSLTPAQLATTCYLRVGKDGRVNSMFTDSAAKTPLADPALESIMKSFHFKPAMQSGSPIESTVVIKLGPQKT